MFLTSVLFFQLMDMSEKLWQVYNRLDPVSLDSLLAEVPLDFHRILLHKNVHVYRAADFIKMISSLF